MVSRKGEGGVDRCCCKGGGREYGDGGLSGHCGAAGLPGSKGEQV